MAVQLGQLRLSHCFARGGMGEIWDGRHLDGKRVAVKVISRSLASRPRLREEFLNEVQMVARMSHPGIVQVYTCGLLPRAAEVSSCGRLVEGAPFLVMELSSMGPLPTLGPAAAMAAAGELPPGHPGRLGP